MLSAITRSQLLKKIGVIDDRLRHLEADMMDGGWSRNDYIAPVVLLRRFVAALAADIRQHRPEHDMAGKKRPIDPGPASKTLTLQQRADLVQVGKDGVRRVGLERPLAAQDAEQRTEAEALS